MKRLYRSKKDRKIAGVCGGLAEYYKTDPTFVRLLYIALTLATGFAAGILFYILAWIIVPEK